MNVQVFLSKCRCLGIGCWDGCAGPHREFGRLDLKKKKKLRTNCFRQQKRGECLNVCIRRRPTCAPLPRLACRHTQEGLPLLHVRS